MLKASLMMVNCKDVYAEIYMGVDCAVLCVYIWVLTVLYYVYIWVLTVLYYVYIWVLTEYAC